MRPEGCVSVSRQCRSVRCCGISFLYLKLVGKSYMIESAANVSHDRKIFPEELAVFSWRGEAFGRASCVKQYSGIGL